MGAALAWAHDALAQDRQACSERAQVVQKLEDRFGETLRSIGLQGNDAVVEVYSSEATGTWTILLTRPDGISCMIAAGDAWQQDVKPIGPQGEPL